MTLQWAQTQCGVQLAAMLIIFSQSWLQAPELGHPQFAAAQNNRGISDTGRDAAQVGLQQGDGDFRPSLLATSLPSSLPEMTIC